MFGFAPGRPVVLYDCAENPMAGKRGRADRMAERDRATVDVDLHRIELEILRHPISCAGIDQLRHVAVARAVCAAALAMFDHRPFERGVGRRAAICIL